LVTSVRGMPFAPITAASVADGVIGFMNAAFGLRFAPAFFLAGALLAAFFFVAIVFLLCVRGIGFLLGSSSQSLLLLSCC
jgi:hypothetical protein